MKQRLLLTLLLFSCIAYSQRTVENPRIGMSTMVNLKIEKIELRDTATVVWFYLNTSPGSRFRITDQSFIQPVGATVKLYVKTSEGIKINETNTMSAEGEISYQLYFPKIDASVSKIDFGEVNEGGSWFIYDIVLKPELFKSIIPSAISGNWFRSDNAQWEISLLDSVAIYKNQVWKYAKYSKKNGTGIISLKKGSQSLLIYSKTINDSICLLGESSDKLVKYTHQPDESVIPEDNELYKDSVFKMDTVTYCGYIKNFSPRFPQRTGIVQVDNVLTGVIDSYVLTIADDGTFKVKFPHCNPQRLIVRMLSSFESIFLEPGKTTFQLIDIGNNANLFMGDCARINTDLHKLDNIRNFDYNENLEKVQDFSPEQYKTWIQEQQRKNQQAIADFGKTHSLSAKAVLIERLDIDFSYFSQIIAHCYNSGAAHQENNNPPEKEIPFKPALLDSSYYSFLTNELVNNPMAALSSEYPTFINRLLYMNTFTGASKKCSTTEIPRNVFFQKVLGIPLGLATDIMESQEICKYIVDDMTPVSDKWISDYQKNISTPFIASYIALKNNEIKAKLEANKKMAGVQVPKTEGDKVFDAIMEKYKGKVVYVDFWATWCGPCCSAIKQIKPLKEEMANENVVFIYISAPSSPKATYDNMIPTIKGEHYRASQDVWNTLCGKFNISGIPHYVLVGKDGKVINPNLRYLGNEELKLLLMNYIKE
jgi:thiol-disulfide isomerase/thioredoxin